MAPGGVQGGLHLGFFFGFLRRERQCLRADGKEAAERRGCQSRIQWAEMGTVPEEGRVRGTTDVSSYSE